MGEPYWVDKVMGRIDGLADRLEKMADTYAARATKERKWRESVTDALEKVESQEAAVWKNLKAAWRELITAREIAENVEEFLGAKKDRFDQGTQTENDEGVEEPDAEGDDDEMGEETMKTNDGETESNDDAKEVQEATEDFENMAVD
jgi:hypothetical protein